MAEPIVVRCRENGPLVVEGPIQLFDHEGNEIAIPPEKEKIALCRCGTSGNKPFCDGSHKTCGFVSTPPTQPQV